MVRMPKQEMSVFLERQSVRRRKTVVRQLRRLERILLSVAVVLAGLACLYGLYVSVFLGNTFVVKTIVVDGTRRFVTAGEIADLSGVVKGDNLFWLSVGSVHERLIQNPWVQSAVVRRRLPDTLWITVEEHQPVAIMASPAGLFYVDEQGDPFKQIEASDDKAFPVVTGVEPDSDGVLSEEGVARIREMIAFAAHFSSSAFGRDRGVAEVHYDRAVGYSLVTQVEPMQILFGTTAVLERIAQLDRLHKALRERGGRIQSMMANEPGRIVVRYTAMSERA